MSTPTWTKDLFAAIDAKDADRFTSFLTEDVTFVYGSQAPVEGRKAVRSYVEQFFAMFQGIEHRLTGTWSLDPVLFCQGEVSYTRHEGATTTLPFLNLLKHDGKAIREYLIYIDPTPLA